MRGKIATVRSKTNCDLGLRLWAVHALDDVADQIILYYFFRTLKLLFYCMSPAKRTNYGTSRLKSPFSALFSSRKERQVDKNYTRLQKTSRPMHVPVQCNYFKNVYYMCALERIKFYSITFYVVVNVGADRSACMCFAQC